VIPWEIQGAEDMHLFYQAGSGKVDQGRGETEWGKYMQDASPPLNVYITANVAFLPSER